MEDKTEVFIEAGADEGSERLKKATDADRDGLRLHAHEKGVGLGHEFFDARSTLARRASKMSPAAASSMSDAASSACASYMPSKRKVTVSLEDSDDQDEEDGAGSPPSHKKAKVSKHLHTQTARFCEQNVEKLEKTTHGIKGLVAKASKVLEESEGKPASDEKTSSARTRCVCEAVAGASGDLDAMVKRAG